MVTWRKDINQVTFQVWIMGFISSSFFFFVHHLCYLPHAPLPGLSPGRYNPAPITEKALYFRWQNLSTWVSKMKKDNLNCPVIPFIYAISPHKFSLKILIVNFLYKKQKQARVKEVVCILNILKAIQPNQESWFFKSQPSIKLDFLPEFTTEWLSVDFVLMLLPELLSKNSTSEQWCKNHKSTLAIKVLRAVSYVLPCLPSRVRSAPRTGLRGPSLPRGTGFLSPDCLRIIQLVIFLFTVAARKNPSKIGNCEITIMFDLLICIYKVFSSLVLVFLFLFFKKHLNNIIYGAVSCPQKDDS